MNLNRKLAPSELNDVFRLVCLAKSVGAKSLDDIKSLRGVRGMSLMPVLQSDVLDEVGRLIKSGGYCAPNLGGKCGESG